VPKTICPIWDEEFSFSVRHRSDSLKLYVKDGGKGKLHSVLSTFAMKLREYKPEVPVDRWFSLIPVKGVQRGGKIHVAFRLDPLFRLSTPRAPHVQIENVPQCIVETSKPETPPVPATTIELSVEFGDIIDSENPNDIGPIDNQFGELLESPAKMYTADAMQSLQFDLGQPVYGPHWALAKITSLISHLACDYITNYGGDTADTTKQFLKTLTQFFSETNYDINRNRIHFCDSKTLGKLYTATFAAYDLTISAMAAKTPLIRAKIAIRDAVNVINEISRETAHCEHFDKTVEALNKACKSQADREDGLFYKNLEETPLDSLGLDAAVTLFGLASLEHAMNCYICNAFGSRIIVGETGRRHSEIPEELEPVFARRRVTA
jgi:hypothetical protein